jgi:hypothetical protein
MTMTSAALSAEIVESVPDTVFLSLLFGGILLLFGLIFGTIGWARTSMCKNWVPSTGVIVTRKGATSGMPTDQPTFGWTGPDGQIYRRTSLVKGGFYRMGRQVPILVHPEQPHRAVVDTFVQKGTIFIVMGSVFAVMGVAFAASGGYLAMNL